MHFQKQNGIVFLYLFWHETPCKMNKKVATQLSKFDLGCQSASSVPQISNETFEKIEKPLFRSLNKIVKDLFQTSKTYSKLHEPY